MGNRDRPAKPHKKQKKQKTAEDLAKKRAERQERKHALKLIRRKATRRGLIRPMTPEIK